MNSNGFWGNFNLIEYGLDDKFLVTVREDISECLSSLFMEVLWVPSHSQACRYIPEVTSRQ